jgi:putative ABC transport system permease protein
MNFSRFLRRSLLYYRRSHIWIILGAALSTAILVGALVIGDSVRFSLRQIVFDRLGDTEFAMTSGDRFFRVQLAEEVAEELDTQTSPVLIARGIVITEGGRRRVNDIQVVGVDARFGEIGGGAEEFAALSGTEAHINTHLAFRLGLKPGDEFLLRMEKLDAMPKDAPLALELDTTLAKRLKVRTILSDSQFGRFNLRADQVAPLTVFLPLQALSRDMERPDRANALLIAAKSQGFQDLQAVEQAVYRSWLLADAGLKLERLPAGRGLELTSDRIFLDPAVGEAAQTVADKPHFILTYFVNELRHGERTTPYSFVAAPGDALLPAEMQEDEILINTWLADDLEADIGDQIQIRYYVLGASRNLIETSSIFRVIGIVPLEGAFADKDLLPDYPGLADVENTRDWRPGIPIDLEHIREKDEDYWYEHRGTPKAFVTLQAAQKIWENRFGGTTAIRFKEGDLEQLGKELEEALDPAQLGFLVQEVRRKGLRASVQGVDFSQLFLGLSFFVILAALLLTGLLFLFNVEKRSQESGLFLALGFPKKQVKRWILFEGAVLVAVGGLLGGVVGVFYNQIIFLALRTVWQDIVGTSALRIYVRPVTVLMGIGLGTIVAIFTIWVVARKLIQQPVSALQRGLTQVSSMGKRHSRRSLILGLLLLGGVLVILAVTDFDRGREAFAFFFTAGFLLLAGGMALIHYFLGRLGTRPGAVRLSLFQLGVRNNARRRSRSLSLIGLLACGLFIVFTVGANRQNAVRNAEERSAGTGGFALFGTSVMPILYDLNSAEGKRKYGLEALDAENVRFVQFRVKEGDDASCLNLNRVSTPQLIGVDPGELSRREAFTFMKVSDAVDPDDPWSVLNRELPDGAVPGVADNTVLIWGLGKSVGDTIDYRDENGETFPVRLVGGLANSVFQGNLIISQEIFLQKYPSLSGSRLFLVDAPFHEREQISEDITWALQDQGMELTPASSRLAEFNRVENTYLSIFMILGSFGLLLGSLGIGIVVWRNIRERRGELALLQAVGFNQRSLHRMILSEHMFLLVVGIFFGLVAALLATLPALLTPGSGIPFLTILALLSLVLLNGGFWTFSAAFLATKEDLIPALRSE